MKLCWERLIVLSLFFASLLLYAATLSPDVLGGDPGEAQFVPYVLGIMHYTGYPLYTLLGKLWTYVPPFGNVAYRMNLLSACAASITIALVYLITRQLSWSRASAVLAAASLAIVPLFWDWATLAGVRALNALLMGLCIYMALIWQRAVTGGEPAAPSRFYLLCLAYGLSLAHHRTAILLAPGLGLFILAVDRGILRQSGIILRGLIWAAMPLLLYLYLPLRSATGAPFDLHHPDNWGRFLDLITARQMSGYLQSVTWAEVPTRLGFYVRDLAAQFTVPGLALGLVGLATLWRKQPRESALFSLLFAAIVAFTVAYRADRRPGLNEVFLIPSYLVFAIWLGLALEPVWGLLARGLGRRTFNVQRSTFQALILSLLAVWYGASGWSTYQKFKAGRWVPLEAYRQLLQGQQARRYAQLTLPLLEDDGLYLADWEQATALWYAQLVEDVKPGVEVQQVLKEEDLNRWIDEALSAGRPAYVGRAFPALLGRANLTCVGAALRVGGSSSNKTPLLHQPANAVLEGRLRLAGFRLWQQDLRRGGVVSVSLYWEALEKPKVNYSVSVRLFDPQGRQVAQKDYSNPVLGLYPTSLWSTGEVVGDFYELALPRQGLPGVYRLRVMVYESPGPGQWRNLTVSGSEPPRDFIELPPMIVH